MVVAAVAIVDAGWLVERIIAGSGHITTTERCTQAIFIPSSVVVVSYGFVDWLITAGFDPISAIVAGQDMVGFGGSVL